MSIFLIHLSSSDAEWRPKLGLRVLTPWTLDMGFVRDIGIDPNGDAVIRTIIALAESLDLETVAEGVETEVQREFLKNHGCQSVQGYLYSPPLRLEELKAFLVRETQ